MEKAEKRVKERDGNSHFPGSRQRALMQILSFCFLYFLCFLQPFHAPPPSPPHCALISLFSYHAELPAHIVFISFVYLVSRLKRVAPAHREALRHVSPFSPFVPSSSSSHSRVVIFSSLPTDHMFAYALNGHSSRF